MVSIIPSNNEGNVPSEVEQKDMELLYQLFDLERKSEYYQQYRYASSEADISSNFLIITNMDTLSTIK